MPDREKVIKGLEVCISLDEGENCPKEFPYYRDVCCGYSQVMRDALALLKEQEPVKPERECSGSGVTWWNVCGNCRTAINPNDKYCHECGKAVSWEGR